MADSVFFDWLGREGVVVLNWWLLATLAGLAAWPLGFRLLRGLPDRGYTLARSLGLILVGYVFWIGASLGLFINFGGNVVLAWLVILASGLCWLERQAMLAWLRANWRFVVVTEILFFALFFGWALFRAANPALTGTEKPMEVAFMSAVQRSETFPPNDPWMSGYAISYYYFGYVMTATLAALSNVPSTVAFNLIISLLFALTGVGAFGVVYNLVRARRVGGDSEPTSARASPGVAMAFGLLGLVFVVLLGNLYTVLVEIPYQQGWASNEVLGFFDVEERDHYNAPGEGCVSAQGQSEWCYWWWFRASRVVRDYDLSGAPSGVQPIDEFPSFSFILADVHPHVLALPFAVLALGLALNLLLNGQPPTRAELLLYGLCLGGMVFLNTWDGPIYMVLLVGAEVLRRWLRNRAAAVEDVDEADAPKTSEGWWALGMDAAAWLDRLLARAGAEGLRRRLHQPGDGLGLYDWLAAIWLGVLLAVVTLVFYAPFFISFRSQAQGILPNAIHPTRFQQFFIMFGQYLLILGVFLAVEVWRHRHRLNWALAGRVAVTVLVILVVGIGLLSLIAWLNPGVRGAVYSIVDSSGGLWALLAEVARLRLVGLPVLILLGGGIAVVVARLFARRRKRDEAESYPTATGFVLLLIGAGAVLALVPDYLYLWDNFSVRINTVFKFYYQAWLMWSVASAYAAYTLLADVDWSARLAPMGRALFAGMLVVLLASGLLYPVLGIYARAFVETGRIATSDVPLTLDGVLSLVGPDEYAVIQCLNDLVEGDDAVVAEAIGPAYHHQYGRVAGLTGVPTLLGWENHEGQWRGATYPEIAGTRRQDLEQFYNDPIWPSALEIARRYGIDYVFVGLSEWRDYDSFGLQKFAANLTPVCQSGDVAVYRVDR